MDRRQRGVAPARACTRGGFGAGECVHRSAGRRQCMVELGYQGGLGGWSGSRCAGAGSQAACMRPGPGASSHRALETGARCGLEVRVCRWERHGVYGRALWGGAACHPGTRTSSVPEAKLPMPHLLCCAIPRCCLRATRMLAHLTARRRAAACREVTLTTHAHALCSIRGAVEALQHAFMPPQYL